MRIKKRLLSLACAVMMFCTVPVLSTFACFGLGNAKPAEPETPVVHTDAEVQAMVAQELALSREVAFYPAAYRGDFDQFYVAFHKLSRAQYEKVDGAAQPGINASHYDLCKELTARRESLRQVADPKSTVWEIWGENMAVESPCPPTGTTATITRASVPS